MKINPTLKLYWYGLILLVTLFPLTILTREAGSKLKSFMLDSTLRKEGENVYYIGTETQDEISRLISVLQHTSNALSLTKDPIQKRQFLKAVLQKEQSINAIHVLNKNGDVLIKLANTNSRISYYSPCLNCPVVSVPLTGNIFTGDVLSIDNKIFSQIAIPVGNQNNIRGILLIIIDPTILWRNIRSASIRKGIISYLTDSSGHLVESVPGGKYPVNSSLSDLKPIKALLSGHKWSGSETYIGLGGEEVFGVVTPVKSLNWWVVSEIPVQTIAGPISSIISYIMVFIFIVFFLPVSIGMLYVKRLLKRNSAFSAGIYPIQKEAYSDYISIPHISERKDMTVMVLPQLVYEFEKSKISTGNTIQKQGDVIDVSKIGSSKLIIKSVAFDLRQVVEDTVELLLLKAGEKGIELIIHCSSDVPAYVEGDPILFSHIIRTLACNATKYTYHGHVLIYVQCELRTGNIIKLKVSVKDSGIGIPEDKLEHIFENLTSSCAAATYCFEGSSMRLSDCRQLTELMGGEIGVSSVAGKGATFWFSLNLTVVKEKYEFLRNHNFKNHPQSLTGLAH